MTLTVYSQRRYLVNGYGFLWQNVEPPLEIRRRIANSLAPGTAAIAAEFFVTDKTMPGVTDLQPDAMSESDRFVLVTADFDQEP